MTKPRYYIVDTDNIEVCHTNDLSVVEEYLEKESCLIIDTVSSVAITNDGEQHSINKAILEEDEESDDEEEEEDYEDQRLIPKDEEETDVTKKEENDEW